MRMQGVLSGRWIALILIGNVLPFAHLLVIVTIGVMLWRSDRREP